MRPKFIADADLNERIIEGLLLREPSIDFLRAADADIRGLPDPAVLRIAAATSRILVSHDRNTMPNHFDLHIREFDSPGLLIASQYEIGDVIEDIVMIWPASEASEWLNQRRFLPL